MTRWKMIAYQNGYSVYEDEETGRLDVIDCYEPPDIAEFDNP